MDKDYFQVFMRYVVVPFAAGFMLYAIHFSISKIEGVNQISLALGLLVCLLMLAFVFFHDSISIIIRKSCRNEAMVQRIDNNVKTHVMDKLMSIEDTVRISDLALKRVEQKVDKINKAL